MADEDAVEHDIGVQKHLRRRPELVGLDRALSELAERQHGVVARRQLFEIGFRRGAIRHRLERGRLHHVHHGVYAVGHRVLSTRSRLMAGVLAGGSGAVLSHRSAAALWGIRRSIRVTEVTANRGPRRSPPGIELHRGILPSDEVTVSGRIPVTTVPRTLLDLAAVLDRHQVEAAIHEAEVLRLTDRLSLDDLVARHPRRRGVGVIKAALGNRRIGIAVTRSELERRFLRFLEGAGLPAPEVNASVRLQGRWVECDCVWRAQRVVVELDGHAVHATTRAFERDRARDRALQAEGWRVVRVTWRQLHLDADAVADDLRGLLRGPGPRSASAEGGPPRLA